MAEAQAREQAETSLFRAGLWAVPICGAGLKTVVNFRYSRLGGSRRSCSLSKKHNFSPKEASCALVSVTHWPKTHRTLIQPVSEQSLKAQNKHPESLWERISLGQNDLGGKRPMGGVGPAVGSLLLPSVSRRPQPPSQGLQQKKGGFLAPKDPSPPKDARAPL